MQPPWSTATSTTTDPSCISLMSFSLTSLGALAPGMSTPPMTRSASRTYLAICAGSEKTGVVPGAEHVVEVRQPVEVHVEDHRFGAHARRELGGVGAHHAPAEDDHFPAPHPRHAGEEDALR